MNKVIVKTPGISASSILGSFLEGDGINIAPGNVKIELSLITPKVASDILAKYNFNKQRYIREQHIRFLAEAMKNSKFTQGTQIHFASYKGNLSLINGQHTLTAIQQSNKSQLLSILYTGIEKKENIGELYTSHDIGLRRNFVDAYRATSLMDEMNMHDRDANLYSAAIGFILRDMAAHSGWKRGTSYYWRDSGNREILMKAYLKYAKDFLELRDNSGTHDEKKVMNRSLIMACYLATAPYNKQAVNFFNVFVDDTNIKSNDASRVFSKFCQTNRPRALTEGRWLQLFSNCWNKYLIGEGIAQVSMAGKFRLDTTPYEIDNVNKKKLIHAKVLPEIEIKNP